MWDLIVSVPDHCLSFYFAYVFVSASCCYCWLITFVLRGSHLTSASECGNLAHNLNSYSDRDKRKQGNTLKYSIFCMVLAKLILLPNS